MVKYRDRVPDRAGVIAQNPIQLSQNFRCRLILLKRIKQHQLRDQVEHFEQALIPVPAAIDTLIKTLTGKRRWVLGASLERSSPLKDDTWRVFESLHFDSSQKGDI